MKTTTRNIRQWMGGLFSGSMILIGAGCAPTLEPGANQSEVGEVSIPYKVIATTGMIGDIAVNVGGDRVEVQVLMGEGVDPHLFSPTRSDVLALRDANVILYNGHQLEGRMSDVLSRLQKQGRVVMAVTETTRVSEEQFMLDEEEGYGQDPHLWMDVSLWSLVAKGVADVFERYDPEGSEVYQANLQSYRKILADLDEEVRATLQIIPEEKRILITAHDAFGYMGRAYQLKVLGIQGLSTDSEAGLRDIRRLVDLLVEQQIPSVFVESSVPDKNVRALIEGAAARGHTVTIGGTLYSDAMGTAGTPEGTYPGMIRHNAQTIANALGNGN